jgi:hypothetical protein
MQPTASIPFGNMADLELGSDVWSQADYKWNSLHKFSLEKLKKLKIFSWDFLMTTVLFRFFCWYMGEPFWSCNFFLSESKCVDLILIRLTKCWNNFFSSKFCIWLYCENGKYMIILWKCQVGIYFFLGLSYDHSFISFFLLVYGRTILVLQIFFINLPLKLFNFNFIWLFPKKKILILNLEEKNVAGQDRKKNIQ